MRGPSVRWFDRLWTFVLVLGLMALIFGCSSCAATAHAVTVQQEYETRGVERMVRSAVRIRIFCDGEIYAYGSGTAVSPRDILTAKHIASGCPDSDDPEKEMVTTFTAQFANGQIYEVGTVKFANGDRIDAAWMANLEVADFPDYAKIADYQPRVGQRVMMYAGDGTIDQPDEHAFQFKDGYISRTDDWRLVVSSHGVPGNSGCGVFDEDGNLIGILWGGSWSASREFYFEASRPVAWGELRPPPDLSTL